MLAAPGPDGHRKPEHRQHEQQQTHQPYPRPLFSAPYGVKLGGSMGKAGGGCKVFLGFGRV
jgi:hypothetical protein